MPRFIYISKTDEENSDYNATFNALRRSTAIRLPPGGAHVGRRQEHHRPHRRAQQAGL